MAYSKTHPLHCCSSSIPPPLHCSSRKCAHSSLGDYCTRNKGFFIHPPTLTGRRFLMQNSGDDDEMEPVSSDEPASSDGERAAAGLLLHRGRNISEVVQELSDAAVRHGLSGGLPELARSLGRVVEQEGTALMLQRAAIVAGLRQMEQQQRHNDDPTVLEELALPHVLKQHMLYSTRCAGRGCVSRGCGGH